jgi:hypothetical protein
LDLSNIVVIEVNSKVMKIITINMVPITAPRVITILNRTASIKYEIEV